MDVIGITKELLREGRKLDPNRANECNRDISAGAVAMFFKLMQPFWLTSILAVLSRYLQETERRSIFPGFRVRVRCLRQLAPRRSARRLWSRVCNSSF